MKRIVLSGTDIVVSRLVFGTASLHHLFGEGGRQKLLAAALDHGFCHFDTAPYYGFGLAEQTLGRFLSTRSSEITIASKVGLYPPGSLRTNPAFVWLRKGMGKLIPSVSRPLVDWSIKRAASSLDSTLRALRRDWVDILFLHEPDPALLHADDFLEWLLIQREQGKIRAWGLAGAAPLFASLVRRQHGLAGVLQVRDSLEHREADVVLAAGRPLQFTYGYVSHSQKALGPLSVSAVVRGALLRNATGSVIVSTRRADRLPELVAAAADT